MWFCFIGFWFSFILKFSFSIIAVCVYVWATEHVRRSENNFGSWFSFSTGVTDRCFWCRGSQFSLRVWPLVGWPCSNRYSHTCEYISTPQIGLHGLLKEKKRHEVERVGKGGVLVDLGGAGGMVGANYDQNSLKEIIKSYTKIENLLLLSSNTPLKCKSYV